MSLPSIRETNESRARTLRVASGTTAGTVRNQRLSAIRPIRDAGPRHAAAPIHRRLTRVSGLSTVHPVEQLEVRPDLLGVGHRKRHDGSIESRTLSGVAGE